MSKKCKAYSTSKLGLQKADNKKAFYAGWDAAVAEMEKSSEVVTSALIALVGWYDAEKEHFDSDGPDEWIMEKARAAIAKARGES